MGFVCIPCSVLCFGARSHLFILQRLFALKHSYVSSWRAWWIATRENRKFCWRLRHLFVFVCEMCLDWARALYLYPLACCASSGASRCLYVVAFRLSSSFDCLACLLLQPSCLQYQRLGWAILSQVLSFLRSFFAWSEKLFDIGLIGYCLICAGRPKEPRDSCTKTLIGFLACTREVCVMIPIACKLKMNWTALVCTPQAVAKLRVGSTPAVLLKAMLAAVCKVAISLPDAALY